MKFISISILLLSFLVINGWAQNSLEGQVYDVNTQEPLIGATVYFPDLKIGSATDVNGHFFVKYIPEGKLLVQIEYIGYSTSIQNIDIKGVTLMDFTLKPSVTELHEVIVTGLSTASEAASDPISHDFVNNETLKQRVSTNVVDVISDQPGISQITTGPAISKPVVRGLGYNRIVTLNNGQPQEGQQWGDEHGIEIDGSSVDRVEIIKGPGSLMYGSDAMAGVINFLQPKPVTQGSIIGRFTSIYQSNSNLIGSSFSNAGNINGYSWQVNLSGKKSGNYQNKEDGKVFNSAFEEFNYNGFVGINRKWGFSHVNFSSFNQVLGLVEGERSIEGNFLKNEILNDSIIQVPVSDNELKSFDIYTPRQNINHLAFSLDNGIYFSGDSRLNFLLGYQQNKRKEFEDPGSTEPGLFFDLKTINYDVKFFPSFESNWEPAFGFSGKFQTNRNLAEEVLIPEYDSFDFGIFSVLKRSFNKVNLSGGIRYDFRNLDSFALYLDDSGNSVDISEASSTRFLPFKRSFNNFSGSIGATYSISERTFLKFNLSRGFRAPNIAELGSNGVHEGTFRYEYGNPDLKPETSIQADAGFHYHADHFSFELATFNNLINNYIFIEKLSSTGGGDSIPDPADPVPAFKFSQSKARLFGGELVVDIHPHPADWLHFENSFSMVLAEQMGDDADTDSTRYLPLIPAHVFRSALKGNFNSLEGLFQNLTLQFGLSYTFLQNRVYSSFETETTTPDYLLLNASVSADLVNKKGKSFIFFVVSAENLLDKVYQSHLNRLKYAPVNPETGRQGIFDMGRNISFKIEIPISFKS